MPAAFGPVFQLFGGGNDRIRKTRALARREFSLQRFENSLAILCPGL